MIDLHEWARRWGIIPAAVRDLRERLGECDYTPDATTATTETGVQTRIRRIAPTYSARLWRNNVGAVGRIRYGLANDSVAVNRRIKSSDLIGVRSVMIGPADVGRIIGQFVAREVKRPGWAFTGTDREIAQERFLTLVASMGGDAKFCNAEGEAF